MADGPWTLGMHADRGACGWIEVKAGESTVAARARRRSAYGHKLNGGEVPAVFVGETLFTTTRQRWGHRTRQRGLALINRRSFFVTAGSTLLAGAAVLGSAPAAQAGIDPSKRPLDVRVASVSGNTVTLSWTAPAPGVGHGLWIYIYDNDAKEFITHASSSGATLKRLRSGTTHTFIAIWGDFTSDPQNPGPNFNVSAPSAPVRVTIAASSDTNPPTVPGNVRTVPVHDGTVFVTEWDPSTDDVTPQDRIQYDAISWTGFTSFYGATSGTQEWGNIRAVDEAGNRTAIG